MFTCIHEDYPNPDSEIALKCAVKWICDTIGPERLGPFYLVFSVISTFPSINTELPEELDRMKAISSAGTEMARIPSKLKILYALRSKLPPATEYDITPDQFVFGYQEAEKY